MVTWWLVLFITTSLQSKAASGFKDFDVNYDRLFGSINVFMFFGIGTPLLLCMVMWCFGKKVNKMTTVCIYGYG